MKVYIDMQTISYEREGMEYERLLDVRQIAEMMGLSVATVRKWVLLRYIPYRKMGRAVRFSLSEIEEWLKNRYVAPLEDQSIRGKIN